MFKKILVAVDRTESGEQILEEAIALAKSVGAALLLLHVITPGEEGYPMPMFPGTDSLFPGNEEALRIYAQQWQDYEKQGLEMLQKMDDQATAAGVKCEFTQNVGDPGRVICELAKNWEADLVLMGRRGRSGLSEMVLGSASNYVLHHAPCSVLALQGKGLN
jgi:nucleotide-binding universal stress UspA family protein